MSFKEMGEPKPPPLSSLLSLKSKSDPAQSDDRIKYRLDLRFVTDQPPIR